ncbi:MAG: hypothetical protein K940chlam9_01918 [Chlamydiae bacterium]|nr:hypothetical protein [Chlamydiota bacterium]
MAIAGPSDDKAPIIEGCYAWKGLPACRVGVDLELYPTFYSAATIPLPVDAIGISILAIAVPSDDKAPIIEGRYAWVPLVACRVGVDLELYPTFHATGYHTSARRCLRQSHLGHRFPKRRQSPHH